MSQQCMQLDTSATGDTVDVTVRSYKDRRSADFGEPLADWRNIIVHNNDIRECRQIVEFRVFLTCFRSDQERVPVADAIVQQPAIAQARLRCDAACERILPAKVRALA